MSRPLLKLKSLYEMLGYPDDFTVPELKTLRLELAKEFGSIFPLGNKNKGQLIIELRSYIMRHIKDGLAMYTYKGQEYEWIVTTQPSVVRKLITPSNFDVCDRMKVDNNGKLHYFGGPKLYARDVMFRTNTNEVNFKFLRTDRRIYVIIKSQQSPGKILGFAECRFPENFRFMAYCSIACAQSGLGRIIIQTVERIAQGYGCRLVLLTPYSLVTQNVWSRHGYRPMSLAPSSSLAQRTYQELHAHLSASGKAESLMYKDIPPGDSEFKLPPHMRISNQWTVRKTKYDGPAFSEIIYL